MTGLGLREVARRLNNAGAFEDTTTAGRLELLRLLRNGKLSAHIELSGRVLRTFSIPSQYWGDVRGGIFESSIQEPEGSDWRLPSPVVPFSYRNRTQSVR